MDEKWFMFSHKAWGIMLPMVALVLSYMGVDSDKYMPLIDDSGNTVMAAMGALLALWSAFRPDGKRATMMPRV